MGEGLELGAAAGFVEPSVHAEFPGLRIDWVSVAPRGYHSPAGVKHRMRLLSNR